MQFLDFLLQSLHVFLLQLVQHLLLRLLLVRLAFLIAA